MAGRAGVGALMPSGRAVMGKVRTPGVRRRTAELLWLARAEFGRLPKTDRTVVLASALGATADFRSETPGYDIDWQAAVDSERAAAKETEKAIAKARERGDELDLEQLTVSPEVARPVPDAVVNPAVVRWLLTNDAALEWVDAAGVRIIAARLSSFLDLQNAVVERALVCFRCVIPGISLMRARTRLLSFGGSLVTKARMRGDPTPVAISADGLVCGGGALLTDGFRSEGAVRLLGADVKGDLTCSGGSFVNLAGCALNCDGLKCSGYVFLRDGFRSEGGVRFLGADLKGDLACSGGSFVNPGGDALSCDGLVCKGTLFLRNTASFKGEVDLTRASVGYVNDHPGEDAGVLNWPRKLRLTGFRYDGIYPGSPMTAAARLRWLEHHDTTTEQILGGVPDPQPYRQLAEVLKKQGHDEDAWKVLFAYACKQSKAEQRLRFKSRRWVAWGWNAFWLNAYLLTVGFGYKRWRALVCLVFLLALGWCVFGYQSGRRMQPAQPLVLANLESAGVAPSAALGDVVGFERAQRYPKFRPLIYSADALIPLVSFHQEDYWTPRSDPGATTFWTSVTSGRWWTKVYLVVHISAGWVLATLFVASFTRLMRVD
ncbi:MAG: hypothetical protein AAGG07_08650 [Planctomycetota bacterium]